jgi:hypothetical protein
LYAHYASMLRLRILCIAHAHLTLEELEEAKHDKLEIGRIASDALLRMNISSFPAK